MENQSIKNFLKACIQVVFGNKYLIYRLSSSQAVIALTFDDGPNPLYTPLILKILKDNGVKATFFLVGSAIEKYPGLARQIMAEGHAVGMHSYSHINFLSARMAQVEDEILKSRKVFKDVLGISSLFFRPPGGVMSPYQLLFCLKHKVKTVIWSIDSMDYWYKESAGLQKHLDGVCFTNGDILLLHDDCAITVNILRYLIDKVTRQGLKFTTIGDMRQ